MFSGVNVWPRLHSAFTALTADGALLRKVLTRPVTGSIWLGLTHPVARHRWSICSPSGIEPTHARYANLCARRSFPRNVNRPYPLVLIPHQSQHPSGCLVMFFQKRAHSSALTSSIRSQCISITSLAALAIRRLLKLTFGAHTLTDLGEGGHLLNFAAVRRVLSDSRVVFLAQFFPPVERPLWPILWNSRERLVLSKCPQDGAS